MPVPILSLSRICPCRFRIPAVAADDLFVSRRMPAVSHAGSKLPPRNQTFMRVYLESADGADTPAVVWLALPRAVHADVLDLLVASRGRNIINLGRTFRVLKYGEQMNTRYTVEVTPASKTDKFPATMHALITSLAKALSTDVLPGTNVAEPAKEPAMPLPSIYKVTSKGLCIGAESVILATSPDRAMDLHKQHTGCPKDMNVEEQQADVEMEMGGKPVTEFVFYANNGDM